MAKIALLIGVSEYEPGLNPLPGAVKDVEAVQQVLLRPDIGGFVESDVTLLKNPDKQKMEEEIEKLFVNRQKDDLLLLFFSGHGIKDDTGKLYLATRNTRKTPRGELIRSSALEARIVHENMEYSRSKRQVVILDSCFSGAFAEGLSAKDDGTVNIREQLGGEGRAVLTSSTSTQYSFEEQGSDLSIYTRYLIEGISTGAADLDGDGVVSIDELHEYASRKVREIQPAMRPELYAIREGFKIRLTKVPPGDPKEKYAKEVRRYVKRGDISFVGRKTLDAHKIRLGLSETEASTIEDEILAVARQEFREKLQHYERDFTEAIQQEIPLSEADLDSLRQNLKQILGLRNEDVQPIEARVRAKIEAYKQHLQDYEQAFTEAMRQEYPLSETTRDQMQQMQQQWELTAEDVGSIESRITAEIEAYRPKLQQYEQAFARATQQEYPITEGNRNELKQQQQNLGLKDEDIAPIEARITAEIEVYRQNLWQYEQAFIRATQEEYPLSEGKCNQLRQEQQNLGLKAEDIAPIEARITAEIAANRQKLQQYEQAFASATQQEYPISEGKRNELRQQQQTLGLKDGDVAPIEARITAVVEDYYQKLLQYEEVLTRTIQHEYPISDEIREELKRYQGVLELRDEDVTRIEVSVTLQYNTILSSDKDLWSPDEDLWSPEIQTQEAQADIIITSPPQPKSPSQPSTPPPVQSQYRKDTITSPTQPKSPSQPSTPPPVQSQYRKDTVTSPPQPKSPSQPSTPPPVQSQYRKDTITSPSQPKSPSQPSTPSPVQSQYRKDIINPQNESTTIPEPAKVASPSVETQRTKKTFPWIRLILLFSVLAILGWQLPNITTTLPLLLPFGNFPNPLGRILMWASLSPMLVFWAGGASNLKEINNNSLDFLWFSSIALTILGIPGVFIWGEVVHSGWTFVGILVAMGSSILFIFLFGLLILIILAIIASDEKIKLFFGANRSFLILTLISCSGLAFGLILNYFK